MEKYAEAKKRFFIDLAPELQILNADDPIGAAWLSELPMVLLSAVAQIFNQLLNNGFMQHRFVLLTKVL